MGDAVWAALGGGSPPSPESGCYAVAKRLRGLALEFFSGDGRGRIEFFPQSKLSQSIRCDPQLAVETAIRAPPDSTALLGGGQLAKVGLITSSKDADLGMDSEEEGRPDPLKNFDALATDAGVCRALGKTEVGEVLSMIISLFPFLLGPKLLSNFEAERDECLKGSSEEEQERGGNISLFIQNCSFVRWVLSSPDVLSLLLHCVFHPSVNLDDLPRTWVEEMSAADIVITALVRGALGDRVSPSSHSFSTKSTVPLPALDSLFNSVAGSPVMSSVSGSTPFQPAILKEAAQAELIELLGDTSRLCKPGTPYSLRTALEGNDVGSLKSLAVSEARVLSRCASHPLASAGIIHWIRQRLVMGGSDMGFPPIQILCRMAVCISQCQPTTSPSVFALLQQALCLKLPHTDFKAQQTFRFSIARELGDFVACTGLGVPVLEWVLDALGNSVLSTPVASILLTRIAFLITKGEEDGASSSINVSPPFCLSFARLLFAVQRRLINARRGSTTPSDLEITDSVSRLAVQLVLSDAEKVKPIGSEGKELAQRLSDIKRDFEAYRVLL